MEEMSNPGNFSSYWRQVSNNRWILSVLLVLVLDLVHLKSIVMEDDSVLGIEVLTEVLLLEDILELAKELKWVFNALDHVEVLVDELL